MKLGAQPKTIKNLRLKLNALCDMGDFVTKSSVDLKISPVYLMAAIDLGYFEKINYGLYRAVSSSLMPKDVRKVIERSYELRDKTRKSRPDVHAGWILESTIKKATDRINILCDKGSFNNKTVQEIKLASGYLTAAVFLGYFKRVGSGYKSLYSRVEPIHVRKIIEENNRRDLKRKKEKIFNNRKKATVAPKQKKGKPSPISNKTYKVVDIKHRVKPSKTNRRVKLLWGLVDISF